MAFTTRPCSQCYRARQYVQDALGRLRKRPATHTKVTTEAGIITIDNSGHTIVDVPNLALVSWIGKRVALDGGWLVDVNTTRRLVQFTRYRKVTITEGRG